MASRKCGTASAGRPAKASPWARFFSATATFTRASAFRASAAASSRRPAQGEGARQDGHRTDRLAGGGDERSQALVGVSELAPGLRVLGHGPEQALLKIARPLVVLDGRGQLLLGPQRSCQRPVTAAQQ